MLAAARAAEDAAEYAAEDLPGRATGRREPGHVSLDVGNEDGHAKAREALGKHHE